MPSCEIQITRIPCEDANLMQINTWINKQEKIVRSCPTWPKILSSHWLASILGTAPKCRTGQSSVALWPGGILLLRRVSGLRTTSKRYPLEVIVSG
jgi:hypothetical protein